MYAAISPSDPPRDASVETPVQVPDGMHGRVRLEFAAGPDGARLKDLYQTSPMRVLFPGRMPGDVLSAALVTTSGGLVGGDRLDVEVRTVAGAAAQVIGQAAEKVYRTKGPDTWVTADLSVGDGGWLEWLPQETIVFDRARLRRTTQVDVAPGAAFLGAELLVFGRTAMGETLNTGLVRDVWDVRRSGERVWADALHLSGDLKAQIDHPAGFDGARAAATCVLVADDAPAHLECARSVLAQTPEGVKCAATLTNGILVARWLAFDAQALRTAFATYWTAMRHELKGLPKAMPRLWHM